MGRAVVLSEIGGATGMVSNGVDGFTLGRAELDSRLAGLLADCTRRWNCVNALGEPRASVCCASSRRAAWLRGMRRS